MHFLKFYLSREQKKKKKKGEATKWLKDFGVIKHHTEQEIYSTSKLCSFVKIITINKTLQILFSAIIQKPMNKSRHLLPTKTSLQHSI